MIRARCLRVRQHCPAQKIQKTASNSFLSAQQRFSVKSRTAFLLVSSLIDNSIYGNLYSKTIETARLYLGLFSRMNALNLIRYATGNPYKTFDTGFGL